ncbi:phosphotransferase family protein [Micromonospora sp. KC723]|uniref:phosphotransferase family protein n=1 Tax=Micromonospora sp. KC723 TaxID=2530381 RepID=UPI00104DF403|nr:aminoglycoside phosphotransferase family protein [Micromonospora sp. KC723]TDB78336.1 aminoglycoside phosphotransferase family protein [Micromonospora sp. KC723]
MTPAARSELDPAQLRQILLACGIGAKLMRSCAPLTGGTYNSTYRVGLSDGTAVVLKVAPDPAAPALSYERDLMRTEVVFYRAAAGRLPVPRVLHAGVDRTVAPRDFLLMTECPGGDWRSRGGQLDAADRARLRKELGTMVAALHEVTGDGFGYPQLGLEPSWSAAFLRMVDAVLADAERFAAPLPEPPAGIRNLFHAEADLLDTVRRPTLVHFDLWDGNILIDATAGAARILGVVDGERAFWGDPLAELVSLALFGRIEQDEDFLSGYRSAGGAVTFDPSAQRRLALYRAYLYLIMLVEATPRRFSGPEHDRQARFVERHLVRALSTLSRPEAGSHP